MMADNLIRLPFPGDQGMALEIETSSGTITLRWVGYLRYVASHPMETTIAKVCLPVSLARQVAAALAPEQIQALRAYVDAVSGFLGVGEELAAWHGFAAFDSLRGKLAAAYQALAVLAPGES